MIAKLRGPGSARAVVADSLLMKQQLALLAEYPNAGKPLSRLEDALFDLIGDLCRQFLVEMGHAITGTDHLRMEQYRNESPANQRPRVEPRARMAAACAVCISAHAGSRSLRRPHSLQAAASQLVWLRQQGQDAIGAGQGIVEGFLQLIPALDHLNGGSLPNHRCLVFWVCPLDLKHESFCGML